MRAGHLGQQEADSCWSMQGAAGIPAPGSPLAQPMRTYSPWEHICDPRDRSALQKEARCILVTQTHQRVMSHTSLMERKYWESICMGEVQESSPSKDMEFTILPSVHAGGERQGRDLICYGKPYVEHKIHKRWEFALACALTRFNQFQAFFFLENPKLARLWNGAGSCPSVCRVTHHWSRRTEIFPRLLSDNIFSFSVQRKEATIYGICS